VAKLLEGAAPLTSLHQLGHGLGGVDAAVRTPWERALWSALVAAADRDGWVTRRRLGRVLSRPRTVLAALREELRRRGLFEARMPEIRRPLRLGGAAGLVLTAVIAGVALAGLEPWGWLGVVAAGSAAVLGFGVAARLPEVTAEGGAAAAAWEGYRRVLAARFRDPEPDRLGRASRPCRRPLPRPAAPEAPSDRPPSPPTAGVRTGTMQPAVHQPPSRRTRAAAALLAALLAAAASGCGEQPSHLPGTGALATAPAADVPAATGPARAATGRGCRLPLSGRTAGGREAVGFVQIADGSAVADPSGAVLPGSGRDLRARTATAPVLYGAAGASPSYNPAAGRWVPAPPAAVAPDGLGYAYGAGDGVHLVDVRNASDRVLGGGGDLEVIGLRAEGVYAVRRQHAGDATGGLLLLDAGSGAVRTLRPSEAGVEWAVAGTDAAWAVAVLPGAGADEVWRLDPVGGVTVWLHRQGAGLRIVGVDGDGQPLVQVAAPQASSVWLVTAPGQARQVSEDVPGGDDTPGYPVSVTDAGGVWMSDDGGTLYRFSRSTGLRRVDIPRLLPTGQRVAGGCS
jgi:hypothetical protein